ncbi:MAG: FAD-binding oxidoreductase [Candidatus Wallbacteria bacterium]|nr:FAD-binding oxidoreductase [Candidatus Wallbacteria bacterium]
MSAALIPESLAHAAQMDAEAARAGKRLTPSGGCTRGWLGRPPVPGSVQLSTAALRDVVHYESDDLTITVQAGLRFRDLQELLARHRQWVPVNPPEAAGSTLGGLLATGACGSLRSRYGAWRDLTLGMSVALSSGEVVKSGGRVVKNVTGYDVHKLHVGALGTLGLIGQVSLKVLPVPAERRLVLASFAQTSDAVRAASSIAGSQLEPAAVEVLATPAGGEDVFGLRGVGPGAGSAGRWALADALRAGACLAVRLAGPAAGCARAVRDLRAIAQTTGSRRWAELEAAECDAAWAALDDAPVAAASVCRVTAPPATVGEMVSEGASLAGARFAADLAAGVLWLLWDEDALVAPAVERLRAKLGPSGATVLMKAPEAVRAQVDVWGPPPPAYRLMLAVKRALDPANVWNPGRYVGEI